MNSAEEMTECPHLCVVGDSYCRLCLEEIRVSDENVTVDMDADGVDWGGATAAVTEELHSLEARALTAPRVLYPEYPPLAEAPISINFKVTGEPMITVRGHDAHQITALLNDMSNGGVWANIAAAQADLRVQGGVGAGLGPVSPVTPQGPPPGLPQGPLPGPQGMPQVPNPQGPPFGPNVSVPSAPGYVGQPSYQSGPPATQGWNGGGGGGGSYQQDSKPEPAMQPPGWMRVNARTGPGFDAWKALREQQKDYLKGKVKWGGRADYWIEPSIAQWLAQQGFAVTP